MDFPVLDALKSYKSTFNDEDSLRLPTDTPFGNFILSYDEIIVRVECLNELIETLYQDFFAHKELVKARGGWSTVDEGFKQKFYTEEVFYWLRKSADELISMIFVLKHYKSTSIYPTRIEVSSIGELLGLLKSKQILDEGLDRHIKLLTLLNEISNGFKHSIPNAQTHNYRGLHEPVVFALVLNRNNLSNRPKFHQVSLRNVLVAYNAFLIDAKKILSTKYQTHSL